MWANILELKFILSNYPQFQDGLSYNKKRLEEAFASGAFDAPSKRTKDASHGLDVKKEHVELIVRPLTSSIERQQFTCL